MRDELEVFQKTAVSMRGFHKTPVEFTGMTVHGAVEFLTAPFGSLGEIGQMWFKIDLSIILYKFESK
jgi:hypothetical protein